MRRLLALSVVSLLVAACSSASDPASANGNDATHDAADDAALDADDTRASADVVVESALDVADSIAPPDAPADAPPDAAGTVVVPLTIITRNTGNGKGVTVPIAVGGAPAQPFLVDTGSAGLRVMADSVSTGAVTRTGTKLKEVYTDGTELLGEEATALVAIGTASTSAPIHIQLIDTIDCVPSKPSCPASSVGNDFFKKWGMVGIVGVGMGNSFASPSTFSPIAQLDDPYKSGFVVHLGAFGAPAGTATLTLGVRGLDASVFHAVSLSAASSPLPNGAPAWKDAAIDVCYALDGTSITHECAPSIFDTGATATFWNSKSVPSSALSSGVLKPGSVFHATIESGADKPFDMTLTVGSPATASDDMVIVSSGFNTNLGLTPFFRFDIAFDLEKGAIAFKAL